MARDLLLQGVDSLNERGWGMKGDHSLQIEPWIRRTFLDERDHCQGVVKAFALPGGSTLDFLSYRHQKPVVPDAPHLFTVHLWKHVDGAVTSAAVRDLATSLVLVRTGYGQILEDAECSGWRRRHRFTVQGNLLGARFERNTLIDTLSAGGGEMAFWTVTPDRIEPYYVDVDGDLGATPLRGVLDHLVWERGEGEPVAVESPVSSRL